MFAMAAITAGLILVVDYWTVERYAVYLFYFMPIIISAWFVGKRSTYAMVLLCSGAWYLGRLNMEPSGEPQIELWNTTISFSSFAFIAWVMNLLAGKQKRMIELQKQLVNLLDLEKKISRRDPLTGALNSRAFYEKLTEERSRSKRYGHFMSLVYIDLDDFKALNDLHGHEFGDDLLKKVVAIVLGSIRNVDVLARLGGDEFVILLPETGMDGAQVCAQRIMDSLKREISQGTTISAGVIHFVSIPDTNEDVVRPADRAMYKAKKSGKDRMVCQVV